MKKTGEVHACVSHIFDAHASKRGGSVGFRTYRVQCAKPDGHQGMHDGRGKSGTQLVWTDADASKLWDGEHRENMLLPSATARTGRFLTEAEALGVRLDGERVCWVREYNLPSKEEWVHPDQLPLLGGV